MNNPVPKAAPSRAPIRVSLSSVVSGKLDQPIRVLLYSVEGCGKSTFASHAPLPVFLGAEDGTSHLDVHRLGPSDMTWQDIRDAVFVLTEHEHAYRTVVIDTVDWAEPLLWRHICERDKKSDIEAYGYGKGYNVAIDEWRALLADLERLRAKRRMHVVLLGHACVRPFKSPTDEPFDRYELKIHRAAAGLLKEWSDCVLFANYATSSRKVERTNRLQGEGGARFMYTTWSPAYDAKNRYDLPPSMALSWEDFEEGVRAHRPADPETLRRDIAAKMPGLDADDAAKAKSMLSRADDASRLAQLNDWINARLALAPKETT